ncbi:MAG: hypothetical protein H7328_00935 [Bdellovibrio sp.]|nr:hypothetical protein [Bdellovibrio sp.]
MPKFIPPNFIVHYRRGEPFRSITSFPKSEWANIVEKLNPVNAWGLNRFADPQYLKQRVLAEAEVREAFIAKGGRPRLEHPIFLSELSGKANANSSFSFLIRACFASSVIAVPEQAKLIAGHPEVSLGISLIILIRAAKLTFSASML